MNTLKKKCFKTVMNSLSYKGTFILFVFIPCLVAKTAGDTRGGSIALATETVVLLLVGG